MTAPTTAPNSFHYFLDQFRARSRELALIEDTVQLRYGDLLSSLERRACDFKQQGVGAGSVVMTPASSPLDQTVDLFALASLGSIAVPLPDLPKAEMEDIADITGATHVTREGGIDELSAGTLHPLIASLVQRREAGLIVLSSGSSGRKKAILHSVERLMAKFLTPRPPYRTLAFLKMDHLGGINTVLHCLSNGAAVIFPLSRKADAICGLIERHRVELLPATPSFLRLLLLGGFHSNHDLSSLRLITYGTEVMPENTLTGLARRFPGVKLQQTYGLSELGVLRSKSESPSSLWVKLGGEGFETKVAEGRLWIKAGSAMEGYLNYPQPFDAGGWMDTGDRVEVNGEYLRVLGRESEIINVAGEKVFPSEVEDFLTSLENIAEAVVRGEPNPLTGNIVVADVALQEPEPCEAAIRRIRLSAKRNLPPFMVPVKVRIVDQISHTDRFKKERR